MAAANDSLRAENALGAAAAGNGPLAGVALARLAEAIVDRGAAPDAAMLLELAAMDRERAGTPEGAALRRAHARGLAASGDFGGAFGIADDPGLRQDVWALLAARGSDGAILAFASQPPTEPALPARTRGGIADRLLDLGLPEAALAWLDSEPAREDDRIRAARAAVIARDGRAALRQLAGIEGATAALLRAEAAVLLGQAEAAAAAFVAAEAPDRAASAIWRLQGWEGFGADAASSLPAGSVTLIGTLTAPEAEAPPATLAGTRQTIDGARAVRAAIDTLLTVVERPVADERG
jgi:hypothetical protein